MKKNKKVLIVGAGVSGATVARKLAEAGNKVTIIDKRNHIGGNCYDYLQDNIYVHKYGPHIFHTRFNEVFRFISKYTKFSSYTHRVIARYKGKLYPIPINLTTVNRFFNKRFDSKKMQEFLDTIKKDIKIIKNSRDVVVSKFGVELYDAFIKYYTKKQWDCLPDALDKEVLERLPVRYDKADTYFNDKHQGMPTKGYTLMFKRMLKHKNITVKLNQDFKDYKGEYDVLIFTGQIDEYFEFKYGKLKYRSLKLIFQTIKKEKFQESSVVNYPGPEVPYTRITEFKQFYRKKSPKTVILKEIPTWKGEPYYPIPKKETKKLYLRYEKLASKEKNVYFLGRLGRYRYLNIDAACKEALELADGILK